MPTYETHRVREEDRKRITCQKCRIVPADVSEHVHWKTGNTTGVSFYYYCGPCFDAQQNKRTKRAIPLGLFLITETARMR